MDFISEGRKIKIVYPLATVKYIETKKLDGKITRRKSPTKKNIYSAFRELTVLCPVLLDKNFTLEILETIITEQRKETEDAVQSKNRRRRFQKNWIKTGKKLEEIQSKKIFSSPEDYIELLPKDLKKTFVFKDLLAGLKKTEPKIKTDEARLFVWCLTHMGILEMVGKEGRCNLYEIRE